MNNISQLAHDFYTFEADNRLFELEDSKNFKYWDIVRYDIYNLIFRTYVSSLQKQTSKIRLISKYTSALMMFFTTLVKAMLFKKKYLFFIASRVNKKGAIIDSVSQKYFETLYRDSFVIETIIDKKLPNRNFYPIPNFSKFFSSDKTFLASKLLVKQFNVNIDFNSEIKERVKSFQNNYFFYKLLFLVAKPKVIFMVQNGIQKAMFNAANDLKIPIVELQHGYIGYVHPAYSYPKEVDSNLVKRYLPSYFFTFSDFWSKNIYFPTKIKSIGGDFSNFMKNDKSNNIVFISANIYHDFLKLIAIEVATYFQNLEIIYKLHPNQTADYQSIKSEFSRYINIKVILGEKNVSELLFENKNVVLIQSTAAYEALEQKNNVYIYKQADYHTHEDIFKYINLFEKSTELIELLNTENPKQFQTDLPSFFDPFDKGKFLDYLKVIENR